ncbi:vinorine synthase-like [Melia azedarach]|uniref:Vinorine synthase-like n=1 Tax=Melia azedarach TaxID=155640 RepID=A0ACC1XRM8_MELAZ|nr:vinorine synthase-like [Melia azedarach]
MEIKIISTEIIKPSSPTPAHLRTHKFFLPDNFVASDYFPVIYCYSGQSKNTIKISRHLKTSLSKTLSYFYPLAGQLKDGVSTDCNDYGVTFIETEVVVANLSEILRKKDNDMLKQLLPLKGNMQAIPTTYHTNVVVQVNYFGCGGIAISTCFTHSIVDGSATAYFIKSWAEVARGADDIKNVIVDYSSIYPPYDAITSMKSLYEQNHFNPTEIVAKNFIFDARKITALKENIGKGPYLDHPTRLEAIATLISGALIKNIDKEMDEFTAKQLVLVIAINLRDKVNPPLPPQCLGSLVTVAIAKLPIDNKAINYNLLAAKFRESVKNVVDQYRMDRHGGGLVEGLENSIVFNISDISKLPFYEADFGWGKPAWVSLVYENHKVASLKSTSDGEGVEALIGLPKEEMAKFEEDAEILFYTQSAVKRAKL